jgi:hypothetical protein
LFKGPDYLKVSIVKTAMHLNQIKEKAKIVTKIGRRKKFSSFDEINIIFRGLMITPWSLTSQHNEENL